MSALTRLDGTINNLQTNSLRVIQDNSLLKWDSSKKHPDITLSHKNSSVALSKKKSGYKAVLSTTSVIIGVDSLSWFIYINVDCTLRLGLSLGTRDLSTDALQNDLIFKQITALQGDRIIVLLDTNRLVIEFYSEQYIINVIPFTGQRMYPWISSVPGSGLYASIKNYRFILMEFDTDGNAQINTRSSSNNSSTRLSIDAGGDGVSMGDISIKETKIVTEGQNFSATVGSTDNGFTVQEPSGDVEFDTKIKTDLIESKPGSDQINISVGSDGIVVDASGNVTVDPGCVITSAIKAPLGLDSSLINNSGLGLTVSDTSGNVTVTGASLVCDELISNTTLLKIGTTSAKVEVANTGVVTEVKGNLDVAEGLDVIGNITATGTINGTIVGLTGSISDSTDVTVTAPSNNQILQYDNASSLWVNRSLATAGIVSESHTHTVSDITDFATAADERITAQKGNVNGLATLDATGKVPLPQLALNSVQFIGTWNADTNTPTLTSSSGTKGNYYVVNVAGSTNLDSITNWQNGDWAIYNGTVWQKVDNTDSVTSVAGKQGTVTLQATDLTDITDAGSGAIITSGERTTISTLSSTYLDKSGGVMSGSIDMASNNLTNINDIFANTVSVGGSLTTNTLGYLQNDCITEQNIILGSGDDQVTLSVGTSAVARSYSIQDKGVTGNLAVIAGNTIGPIDDNDNNSVDASFLEISGANKTAGTGNGGNLVLRGGSSVGGDVGHIGMVNKTHFKPQSQPTSAFPGDIYYDINTNKLRTYNGTSWIDLH